MANKLANSSALVYSFSLQTMGFITWLVFLVLKLTGVVAWGWFWVFFPLWLPMALTIILFIIVFIIIWRLE